MNDKIWAAMWDKIWAAMWFVLMVGNAWSAERRSFLKSSGAWTMFSVALAAWCAWKFAGCVFPGETEE